jgi:probable HAF family extracellular repeat protein
MSHRPFAPSTALLAGLTAAALGCSEGPQSPTSGDAGIATSDATAAAVTYTVKDLGTLGGEEAAANAINDHGGVVGWSLLANGRSHAFLWRAGKMRDLGALAGGASEATEINNNDVVVGWTTVASGAKRAVKWQNGNITKLGTLGGRNSVATAINDLGVIVGWSETNTGKTHAFIWRNGVMQDIGALGGGNSQAWDINRAGKVVGGSEGHAFTWKDGVFVDLGKHGHEFATATAINTQGQVAGVLGALPDAEGAERDFVSPFIFYRGTWSPGGGSGGTNEVHAINQDGVVAGFGFDFQDDEARINAWVFIPGVEIVKLPPLTPGGIDRNRAHDINSFGTVVGSSAERNGSFTGPSRAVLWRLQ